jgi:hypothetical protein
LEWDRLQVDLQWTLEILMPALVKLASNHILQLLGIIAWGVGAISPFNMKAKLEHDENLALVIQTIQAEYAKAFKGIWMEYD